MKIRTDFVTNSSSSSFVIIYEINDCEEFRKELKEQLGEVGLRLASSYFTKNDSEIKDYLEEDFDPNKTYFKSIHYTYSDDPDDFDREEIFLENYMPKEYVTRIYEE